MNLKNIGERWPAILAGVCLSVPLVFDPRGRLPFFPPKEAVLLFGVSLAAVAVAFRGLGKKTNIPVVFSPVRPKSDITIPLLMALFWAWSVAAPLMKTESAAIHLRGAMRLTALVALAFGAAAATAADPRWKGRLAAAIAIPAVVMALHALLQAAGYDPLAVFGYRPSELEGRWRTFTTAGNPNWTAGYLAATSSLLAWSAHRAAWFIKPRLAGMVQAGVWSILAAAVLTTGSRLGLAALFVSAFFWWRLYRFSRGPLWIAMFLACGALVVLVGFVSETIPAERWADKASAAGRLVHARAAWTLISDAPVAGYGLDQSGRLIPDGLREVVPRLGAEWTPWIPKTLLARVPNALLETAVESGMVGAALLLALWMAGLHRAFSLGRIRKEGRVPLDAALAGVLAATAVLAIGCTPFHNANLAVPFWMAIGLLARGIVRRKVKAQAEDVATRRSRSGRVVQTAVAAAVLIGAGILARQGAVALIVNRQANLAHAAFIHDRDDAAERIFRNVLARDPTHHEAAVILSWYLIERGRPLEALDLLDRAERYAVSVEAWLVRALALKAAGRPEAAAAALEDAVAAVPDLLRAHVLLGDVYDEMGDTQRAMAAYCRALESPQNSPEALVWKERVRKRLSWLDSWRHLNPCR